MRPDNGEKMSLKFMKHGTRVEVKSHYDDSPYITIVESVLENGYLLLDIMRLGGSEMRLSVNRPYSLRFFSERGVYKFTAVLHGYMRKGIFDYMLFQTSDSGEKIQRRQSYRLACGKVVEFNVLQDIVNEAPAQKGFIRDISSGGVRLLSNDELDASRLLRIQLPMIKEGFWVYGAILSKQQLTEAKYKWRYGIEFVGATATDTEKIIMYVHNEQRKAMARK